MPPSTRIPFNQKNLPNETSNDCPGSQKPVTTDLNNKKNLKNLSAMPISDSETMRAEPGSPTLLAIWKLQKRTIPVVSVKFYRRSAKSGGTSSSEGTVQPALK